MDGAWEWALKTRVNGLVIHLLCPLTPLLPLPPPPPPHTLPPFSVLFCPVDTQASAHVHARIAAQVLHNCFGLMCKCLLPSPRFKTERQRGMQVFMLIPNLKPFSAGLSRNTYFGELERILFCSPLPPHPHPHIFSSFHCGVLFEPVQSSFLDAETGIWPSSCRFTLQVRVIPYNYSKIV